MKRGDFVLMHLTDHHDLILETEPSYSSDNAGCWYVPGGSVPKNITITVNNIYDFVKVRVAHSKVHGCLAEVLENDSWLCYIPALNLYSTGVPYRELPKV